MLNRKQVEDRLDPRLRAIFAPLPTQQMPDVESRDQLLAETYSDAGVRAGMASAAFLATGGQPDAPEFADLEIRVESITSQPDGNTISLQLISPASGSSACVYYIHGGGMQVLSAFDPNYQSWGKLIASCGVNVLMVEFRNALRPSAVGEIAPYPAGLNDCVSGLRWARNNAAALGIDRDRMVVAGDSGGANLALATAMRLLRDGEAGAIAGVYVLAPFLSGVWPAPDSPSSSEFEGLFINLHHNRHRMGYGLAAFEARDPLAWPGFASEADVRGLPPVVVNVNECDPLRDEGVAFYRLLTRSGVAARCRQSMGTVHATEVFPAWCPDISRACAMDIASFAHRPGT